jgi:tRNA(adenine34) deaminase
LSLGELSSNQRHFNGVSMPIIACRLFCKWGRAILFGPKTIWPTESAGPKMPDDIEFMREALAEAAAAATAGEVPVGAVLVYEGQVLARSGNRTIRDCDPTAHAEMVVLREAARLVGNYRLVGTTLYVTVEPCSMCAGAMIQARVPRLVYGTDDPRAGAFRSCFEVLSDPRLNHRVDVTPGVLSGECAAVIQAFFAERRV